MNIIFIFAKSISDIDSYKINMQNRDDDWFKHWITNVDVLGIDKNNFCKCYDNIIIRPNETDEYSFNFFIHSLYLLTIKNVKYYLQDGSVDLINNNYDYIILFSTDKFSVNIYKNDDVNDSCIKDYIQKYGNGDNIKLNRIYGSTINNIHNARL